MTKSDAHCEVVAREHRCSTTPPPERVSAHDDTWGTRLGQVRPSQSHSQEVSWGGRRLCAPGQPVPKSSALLSLS